MGVYHPNPTLHHIKKENIGLIEVMGLAVLPSRLAKEMAFMEEALLKREKEPTNSSLTAHYPWICEILEKHENITKENVKAILQEEIGKVFLQVLLDAGVFKQTEAGKKAFGTFISFLTQHF